MSPVLLTVFLLLAATYVATNTVVHLGLRRVLRSGGGRSDETPPVSVVVAARNEQEKIAACLTSILRNDYPSGLLEIIVVDDGSTDRTTEIVNGLREDQALEDRMRLIQRPPHGKHRAIAAGVDRARGEVVLTTDADCVVSDQWIRSMCSYLEPDVGFVAGPVIYNSGAGLLSRAEALEFLSLVGFGAGALGAGYPMICNSANVAYRKRIYDVASAAIGSVEAAASDELLLHFVHRHSAFRVAFCASPAAVVTTNGTGTLNGFIRQRARWASTVRHLPGRLTHVTLAAAYVYFAFIATALAGAIWNPSLLLPAIGGAVVKAFADALVAVPVARFYNLGRLLRVFPLAELLHIPYILIAAPAGLLNMFSWKGESIRPEGARLHEQSHVD